MKKLTLICIAALCAVILLSACGMPGDNGMPVPPAATDDLMPDASDGTVNDRDGHIGNEGPSDPAGDAVDGQTVPDTTVPESAVPQPSEKPKMK